MEPYLDIDINIGNQFHPHQSQAQSQSHTQTQQSQTQQSNSAGLLRFRSAPSSLLSSSKLNPPQYPNLEFVHQGNLLSGVSSSLTRQTSSPPGFLSQLNHSHLPTNGGYRMVRGVGNLRAANGGGGDSSRLKPQIDFPTPHGRLPRIPELGSETTATKETSSPSSDPNNHRCGNVDEDDATRFCRPTGFAFASSWNNPSEGSSGHQQNDKVLLFSGLDDASALSLENGSLPHCAHMLSHHLSLPKTSAEIAAVEKLLNYQDTIPCKIRAKRGCATHPRSIAERVRRTRISERMKKLQDLVPNMDKQVNTADMLDLAVEYIKELQKQHTALNDNRARCECIHLKQYAAVD